MSVAAGSATAETSGPGDPLYGSRPSRRHRRWLLCGVLVVMLAAAGAIVAATGSFEGASPARAGVVDNADPTAFTRVSRGSLSSDQQQTGTLGYLASSSGSPYTVINQATGTATWLPSAGRVFARGQVLYGVSGGPVVLLYGGVPAYRALSEGMTGADVRELNANLVALGDATRAQIDPSSDYFSAATAYALGLLQAKLGVDETRSLALGAAVFLPGRLRITTVQTTLGASVMAGSPVLQATSTRRQVVVQLDAAEQSSVAAGDRVVITLPNNQTTPGVVTSVGTVASTALSASGGAGSPTVAVYIAPLDSKVTGTLDQAPVQVQITTGSVNDALIVPVDALLALAGGGYAVETVNAAGIHHLATVTLGLFDDADGLVQVFGSGLQTGQRIVIPVP